VSIDGANRLSSLNVNGVVQGFGYDTKGYLTSRGAQGFGFDIGIWLRSAFGHASYAYDGHGRRTWLAYGDGSRKLQVYSEAGKLLWTGHSAQGNTKHIYLGDRLIAEANNLTGVSYSHTDALGSPVARTNVSTQITSRTRYEPYGATAAGTNPTGIGFTGHVNDADTGLVYMQQRYYEPLAGRFLSVDPVTTDFKTGAQFNRYAYVNNNPYKFKDPDGRLLNFAFGFVTGAAIEAVAQYAVTGSVGDLKAVGIAGAAGAITGGVGGALAKAATAGSISAATATAGTAAAGGVTGGVGKAAEAIASGKPVSAGDVATGAVGGAIGAGVGGKISNAATANIEKAVASPGIAGHVGQTTQAAIQQGGRVGATTSAFQEAGKVAADLSVSATQKKMEQK
jgi:RHS repeat-associated protein